MDEIILWLGKAGGIIYALEKVLRMIYGIVKNPQEGIENEPKV